MPPPHGNRNTMIVRRARPRPPDQQEAGGSGTRPTRSNQNDRVLSQNEHTFPSSNRPFNRNNRFSYQKYDRTFHSNIDMPFDLAFGQTEGFGDRINHNFPPFGGFSGPHSSIFPLPDRGRGRSYPHNTWEPSTLPTQQPYLPPEIPGPSSHRPFSKTPLPSQSISHQIRKVNSQPNQNQNRKKYTPQSSAQASTSASVNRNGGTTDNKIVSHTSQELKDVMEHYKMFACPDCKENYMYKHHQTRLAGKVPLVLHCSHTVCQECIYKKMAVNKIICPICKFENVLTRPQTPNNMVDLQKTFQPNYYILGMMFFGRPPGGFLGNLDNIKLVSNQKIKNELPPVTDRCCFGTCLKEATMYCPNCDGIYCGDCCTVVHKSTKTLMCHEPVPRKAKKFSFKLESCPDHRDMLLEFFCNECEITACCYCLLDRHGNHERVLLYQLTDSEKEEFQKQREHAVTVLKEVIAAQKKVSKLSNFSTTPIKREIAQHFADRHAKLYTIEKRLFEEIGDVKTSSKGLEAIQSSLKQTAEMLKLLVRFDHMKASDQKLNLRGALHKLKDIDKEPRFLLNSEGISEVVRFVNNFTDDEDTDTYQIVKCEDAEFKLVAKDDLPDDYIFEDLSSAESEIEKITKASESVSNLSLLDDNKLRFQASEASSKTAASGVSSRTAVSGISSRQGHRKSTMEKVEVQHINSMDSFFVQYKNMQSKLNSLNKEIENYVKIGGAENVHEPQINKCYLILYIIEQHGDMKEQKWCRGRVVALKDEDSAFVYEAFFMDYGKTQFVTGNRIKDIPAFLLKHPPFAVECRLYNPMNVDWNDKAHVNLAKILNGKQVFMVVKSTDPSGVLMVDLTVSSSDGSVTSVIDMLVYTKKNTSNDDNASVDSTGGKKEGYCPQLKVFPNNKRFTKNQTEKVILANVVDPHNIFVHMDAHKEAFKNMLRLIKKAYKHSKGAAPLPIEGTFVLLEYRDSVRSNWHRAFLKSVDMEADEVHAVLIDWGLTVVVPSRAVRPMQESFTKMEAQAVLVKLAHIAPFDRQATWSSHAANFLQTYLASQERLKMVVNEVDSEVSVTLFDLNGSIPMCINALLVDQNLADSTGPISTKLHWPEKDASHVNVPEEDGILGSMLKKVDEAESDSGEEDSRDIKRLKIEMLKFVSPDELYVKFQKFHDKEVLLCKELNIFYSKEAARKTQKSWRKDEFCVVELERERDSDPSEFARGKIIGAKDDGYEVFLYDKAQEVVAPLSKIFVSDKYFGVFLNQAIRGHLANIRPAGDTGKWSISSIEALEAIFQKRKRLFAVKADQADVSVPNSVPFDMWYGIMIPGSALEPDHMKYVSINQTLINWGYAYKRPAISNFEKVIIDIATPENEEVKTIAKSLQMLNQTDDNKSTGKTKNSKGKKLDKKDEKQTKKLVSSSEGESSGSTVKSCRSKDVEDRGPNNKSEKPLQDEHLTSPRSKLFDKISKSVPKNRMVASLKEQELKRGLSSSEGESSDNNAKHKNKKKIHKKSASKDLLENDADSSETEKKVSEIKSSTPVNWIDLVEEESSSKLDKPSTSNAAITDKGDKSDNSDTDASEDDNTSPYHRKEVDISDWLPPFRLTRREFRGRVTCLETSGHLYLHDESIHEAYEMIQENIKAYFDTNPPKTEDDSYWQPGRLCTIKYQDGNWYRGRVLKVKSPTQITVIMIDFGSDHDVHPEVLYREVLYTDIEAFGTKVKLDKVYAKEGVWLSSDYDAFMDLVTDWCQIIVKGPINVEIPLVEVINEDGVNVNEELVKISQNLVARLSGVLPCPEGSEDEMLVIEEELREYYSDGAGESASKTNSKQEEEIQQNVERISCNSMLEWRYKRQPLPVDLCKGEKVLLEVGGIISYNKIFLKECGQNPTEEFYNLIIDIQDLAETLPQLTDLKVGVPCIAPFSEDGVWYRAKIANVDELPLGKVEVYFVDYGNSESVKVADVHALRRDWLDYPQQTWEVSLAFKVKDKSDEEEVYQVISLLQSKRKLVKLTTPNPPVVELYEKDALCYQNLVDLGLIEIDL